MFKRILIPFDGSESSRSALSIASSIAGIAKAELLGLFVADEAQLRRVPLAAAVAETLLGEVPPVEPLPPDEMLEASERLDAVAKELELEFEGSCRDASLESEFLLRHGIPAQVIAEYSISSDLVIIGARGRDDESSHYESGTTVLGVIERTPRPVLVVPEEPLGESRILVAYDGSFSCERALVVAAELAAVTDMADVHLLTVSNEPEVARKLQKPAVDYLEAYDLEVTPVILPGKPAEVIRAYCDKVDASIVALGATGGSKLMNKLFGSTASHLLADLEAALLVVS